MTEAKSDMQKLKELVKKRDDIEKEIREITQTLNLQGYGLKGNLVDREGFPIGDVEKILQVREARNRLAILQTDHINLMKQIEHDMYELHSKTKPQGTQETANSEPAKEKEPTTSVSPSRENECFAVIGQVVVGSPAFEAGLLVNDKLIQFGSLNKNNCSNNLKPIGELVMNSENRSLQLVILRNNSDVKYINVTPKKWSGRGLLGCQFNPII